LAEGTPVLGIASNLDQYLAMSAVRDAGAGILLRASTVTEQAVADAARTLLEQPSYREAAERAKQALADHDHRELFPAALARVLGPH
jgi:UDP:flavonoid glycosyltransferase YjiC (YdhE family)